MSVKTRELKDKFLRQIFIEAKCSECKEWETYSKNQVPIYTDGKTSIVVCINCR